MPEAAPRPMTPGDITRIIVRFPDENHELSRSGTPRHRLARCRFILEWFGEHLAPAVTSGEAPPPTAST
jgi:hypothetical protein